MKRFWLKLSFWAVVNVAAALFAVSAAFAGEISEHNEQHAAEQAAENPLYDAGCIRTNKTISENHFHSRSGRQRPDIREKRAKWCAEARRRT